MSSKRRSSSPRQPRRSKAEDLDEELPTLEPIDGELEELPLLDEGDEADDGPVTVTLADSEESGFEQVLMVDVPEMEKAAVPDAVTPPLQRAAQRHGMALRRRRVLVQFGGQALIGSAMKEVVATALEPHKPALVVVRRGYGDEQVLELAVPELTIETTTDGDLLSVTVDTGALETADLPLLLPKKLDALAPSTHGKKVTFVFRGDARADAATRELLTATLRAAGADRIAVGARVLFDRALHDAVRMNDEPSGIMLSVTPLSDPALTDEALAMFEDERGSELAGKPVRVRFSEPPPAEQREAVVATCRRSGASRIALADGDGEDVVWPPAIEVASGREVVLRVQPSGRHREALLTAFARELVEHTAACRGKAVVIDWPAGFALDAEVESEVLGPAIPVLAPAKLACTIAGEDREPFVPEPFVAGHDGGVHTLKVDVDAGKPPELVRAFERRRALLQEGWHGQAVRVVLAGATAPSRSLLRTICDAIEQAGATRLEVDDHGTVDVLLPPMLVIHDAGSGAKRIAVQSGGRDEAQQHLALARELDAADVGRDHVAHVEPSALDEALIAALVDKGVAVVVLASSPPVRVHPVLLAAPESAAGDEMVLVATPTGNAGTDVPQAQHELARRRGQIEGRAVTVVWPGDLPEAVVAAFVGQGVATLLHDRGDGGRTQVHPPIEEIPFEPVEELPDELEPVDEPEVDATTPVAASFAPGTDDLVTVLGRRDAAAFPSVLIGVAAGDRPEHVAAVEAALQPLLPAFQGRATLLVLRDGEVDVPVRSDNELARMLRRVVPATAAVTLLFRGPDALGRPHFEVVHSTVLAMPRGRVVADPRRSRAG